MKDLKSFQSKINFAPINSGFALEGKYTKRVFDFYNERSGKNIYSVCIGNVAYSLEYATNSNTATFEKKNFPYLIKLREIIENNGSIASIQIGLRHSPIFPQKTWKKNFELVEIYSNYVSSLHAKDILNYFYIIEKSVKIACSLGYTSIQIHAAHGYLISLLLCRSINRRNDLFSYDKIGGMNVLFDLISKHINKVDIRINAFDGIDISKEEINEKKMIIDYLYNNEIVNKISLSNGIYDITKYLIYPDNEAVYTNFEYACELTQSYNRQRFEVAGRSELIIRKYQEQLDKLEFEFAIGRGLIANPNLATDVFNESTCNQCGGCHYFSNGNKYISCSMSKL